MSFVDRDFSFLYKTCLMCFYLIINVSLYIINIKLTLCN
jgi:hypothetical protein